MHRLSENNKTCSDRENLSGASTLKAKKRTLKHIKPLSESVDHLSYFYYIFIQNPFFFLLFICCSVAFRRARNDACWPARCRFCGKLIKIHLSKPLTLITSSLCTRYARCSIRNKQCAFRRPRSFGVSV